MAGATDRAAEERVNILLVDDQAANLLALEATLRPLGQNLVRARSGDEALRHLLHQDFAVILLDVQMKGLDGFETAQLIRGRDRSRHTPIIFLTAYEDDAFPPTKAYSLGAVDYLIKPVVPEILRAKVTGFVELFRKTLQIQRQAEQLCALERKEFERRLAETARQEEERFRLIVENIRDYAIFLLDPGGNVLTWNGGAERTLGYRAEEILGRSSALFFTPQDVAADRPARELREASARGRAYDDNWMVRKDGSRFWASGVTTALPDGPTRGFVKILRDLTERKALEDELLQRAEALAEAGQQKDRFLAMLAHELRNPLAPVLNTLHLLRLGGGDEGVRRQALDMMDRQVHHLARLLDDLLDVSRITQGRVHLRPERLDLARLVRLTAEDRRQVLEQAGLRLRVEAPPTPVWATGDRTRLAQVLNNLLDNAAKFTDRGGEIRVRLLAEAGPGPRDLGNDPVPQAPRAVLTVRDTGIGIPPDMLPRLFDVFIQADQSLDRARGGLGLGLSVVRGLVELHGGEITAASAGPGRGAEFTVCLPLQPAGEGERGRKGEGEKGRGGEGEKDGDSVAPSPPLPEEGAAAGLRILVVEDSHDAAESLKLVLESSGHEVRLAHSGPEGVRSAAAWRPDVVLCDIGLPGLDGYAVARQLRSNPDTARARMLAITGYGAEEDRARSHEAGFDAHLVKPVDPVELQHLLTA